MLLSRSSLTKKYIHIPRLWQVTLPANIHLNTACDPSASSPSHSFELEDNPPFYSRAAIPKRAPATPIPSATAILVANALEVAAALAAALEVALEAALEAAPEALELMLSRAELRAELAEAEAEEALAPVAVALLAGQDDVVVGCRVR